MHLPLKRAMHASTRCSDCGWWTAGSRVSSTGGSRRDDQHLYRASRSAHELRPATAVRGQDLDAAVPDRGYLEGDRGATWSPGSHRTSTFRRSASASRSRTGRTPIDRAVPSTGRATAAARRGKTRARLSSLRSARWASLGARRGVGRDLLPRGRGRARGTFYLARTRPVACPDSRRPVAARRPGGGALGLDALAEEVRRAQEPSSRRRRLRSSRRTRRRRCGTSTGAP